MPTKPNRAGNQQNYVPAGNGDASGEYGDNESGSNIHFKVFKRPEDTTPKTYKTSSKSAKFQWNNYWNKWYYVSEDEYARYLRQKENAERWGYKGYEKDKFKDIDIKVFGDEEAEKIVKDVKPIMERNIEKADIYELNKVNGDQLYKDSIKELLGNDLNEDELEVFYKDHREKLRMNSMFYTDLINKRCEKVANEYIEKTFPKIKGEHSIEDDLKNCNPKYNEGGVYRVNCQRCPYVYELRRRGYDVQAFPNDDDYGRKKGTNWTRQMIPSESYSFKNNIGARNLYAKIKEKVLAAGNGSRWALDVQWFRSTSSHLCIVENVDGEVKIMDSQSGNSDCIRYLNNVAVSKTTTIKRMDNAKFNIGVIMTGFNPEEK